MKNRQKGFGVVGGLLVLVAVALIGFVGWYVWHAKNTNQKKIISTTSDVIHPDYTSHDEPCYTLNNKWEELPQSPVVVHPDVAKVLEKYKWADVEVRLHSLENLPTSTMPEFATEELAATKGKKILEEASNKILVKLNSTNFDPRPSTKGGSSNDFYTAFGFYGCITKEGVDILTKQQDISKIYPGVAWGVEQ